MGLTAAFDIGRSALTAAEIALQVTGNNLANAATPGYTRQVAYLRPSRGSGVTTGYQIGRGVEVYDIRRSIDEAVQARLRGSISKQAYASQELSILSGLEASLNELTDHDLSTELSDFFGAWSELANLTQSSTLVVEQGEKLAATIRRLRQDMIDQRALLDNQVTAMVRRVDEIVNEIATVNDAVATSEATGGTANSLRDQRDQLLTELSEYVDITAVEQESGAVNVLIGSTPVVLGSEARGVELITTSGATSTNLSVQTRSDGSILPITSGSLGALLTKREEAINDTISRLNDLASQLIFETNKLHSTGTIPGGYESMVAELQLEPDDWGRALNDPDNATLAGLPFSASNGGFFLNVTRASTGNTQTIRIDVDLDGIQNDGTRGYDDDTSLEDIVTQINNAGAGVTASISVDGRLTIEADEGMSFSFSDDTSDALAVLGVNAYFKGTGARDIAISDFLREDPTQLAVGRYVDGTYVENGNALQLADLQETAMEGLGGQSVREHWSSTVQAIAVITDSALGAAEATSLVRESLEAQRASLSGVSVDEESINLIAYQQQYQAAARFIQTVSELTDTIISIF